MEGFPSADSSSLHPPKRSLGDLNGSEPSLTGSGTKRPRMEGEEMDEEAQASEETDEEAQTSEESDEEEAQAIREQLKNIDLQRLCKSFLENFVDPLPAHTHRPRPVDPHVAQWLDSLSGSDGRSDTLGHSKGEIMPAIMQMVSAIAHGWNSDGFALPSIPSAWSGLSREDESQMSRNEVALSDVSGDATGSSRSSLVEHPDYRRTNLAGNNIHLRSFNEEFPEDIARLVNHVRKNRDSPGPSIDQLRRDTDLYDLEMGTAEPVMEEYFKANLFPNPRSSDSVKFINRYPMAKYTVPDVGSRFKVSTPVPDMLYGYDNGRAFPRQQGHLISLDEMVANTILTYPFFVVEFKADGPGGPGSMWAATNKCLGSSATCINVTESLNCQLRQCKNRKVSPVNSAVFSAAMNGTEARLYISWKQNGDYYTRRVESFILQRPDHFLEFRKYVLNIIDWGKAERLNEIRSSLEILDESLSEPARSWQTPVDNSASGGSRL